jgi:hypothetical protein
VSTLIFHWCHILHTMPASNIRGTPMGCCRCSVRWYDLRGKVAGKIFEPAGSGKIRDGFFMKAWRTTTLKGKIGTGSMEKTDDDFVPVHGREHGGREAVLCGNIEVGACANKHGDGLQRACKTGQHEGRLSVSIERVDVCPDRKLGGQ